MFRFASVAGDLEAERVRSPGPGMIRGVLGEAGDKFLRLERLRESDDVAFEMAVALARSLFLLSACCCNCSSLIRAVSKFG